MMGLVVEWLGHWTLRSVNYDGLGGGVVRALDSEICGLIVKVLVVEWLGRWTVRFVNYDGLDGRVVRALDSEMCEL